MLILLFNRASRVGDILWLKFIFSISFIRLYTSRNELLWSDGFIFDFLQKKTVDLWLRKFLIYTGFLFSERLLFESIIRFYADFFILPLTRYFYIELPNISSVLSATLYLYFAFFIILFSYLSCYYI